MLLQTGVRYNFIFSFYVLLCVRVACADMVAQPPAEAWVAAYSPPIPSLPIRPSPHVSSVRRSVVVVVFVVAARRRPSSSSVAAAVIHPFPKAKTEQGAGWVVSWLFNASAGRRRPTRRRRSRWKVMGQWKHAI